jgi:photosystem II 13kDa protein
MAKIQFSRGVDETVVPDVRLTRSRSGDQGTATFIFTNPDILRVREGSKEEITGMYMIDEEGEMITREVKGTFINGKPEALEAVYLMKSVEEWDRFMRFMERYAEENDLGLSKS